MQEINLSRLDDLSLIEQAAVKAGEIALKHFGKDVKTWYKRGTHSPVSEADLEVDQYLKKRLLEMRPGYGWLSEETRDDFERLKSDIIFIVDPIDGTQAFIDGMDEWCISIAVVQNGFPAHGVLFAPVRKILFSASSGQGARINRRPVNLAGDMNKTLPARIIIPRDILRKVKKEFIQNIKIVDGLRSLALVIAELSHHDVDGVYIRRNSHDWDIAAAHIIISEAGYKLVNLNLDDVVYNKAETKHGLLIAARPDYIKTMRDAFKNDMPV